MINLEISCFPFGMHDRTCVQGSLARAAGACGPVLTLIAFLLHSLSEPSRGTARYLRTATFFSFFIPLNINYIFCSTLQSSTNRPYPSILSISNFSVASFDSLEVFVLGVSIISVHFIFVFFFVLASLCFF